MQTAKFRKFIARPCLFFAATGILCLASSAHAAQPVALVKNGVALLPVLVNPAVAAENSVPAAKTKGSKNGGGQSEVRRAAEQLQKYVKQMSGADLKLQAATPGAAGCYVGLDRDFLWLKEDLTSLGDEGFLISSDGTNLCLLAHKPLGVRHAVSTFLAEQGCRWFFPGQAWEVVPKKPTIEGAYDLRQLPSFVTERRLWYGFGASPHTARDHDEWMYHNRMGGPVSISIGHTSYGLDAVKDFAAHPDWFALVKGQRKTSKPCYSHPEVIRKMIEYALGQAARGAKSISLTPSDGLGYCECERCRAFARGGTIKEEKGSFFATRPDGVRVCIVSESLFTAINQVAKAVGEKYPDVALCSYGYSAYSEPPSFRLEPNVAIEVTTAYRRTSLSLEEQLDLWGQRVHHLGVRGYWAVYQWDFDGPILYNWTKAPKKHDFVPESIQRDLRNYRQHRATAFNAEASNNWGPRGLSYYVGAQLLWKVDADAKALVRDFYQKAFGPAAKAMEHYYVRWYGPSVAVTDPAFAAGLTNVVYDAKPLADSRKTLAAAFKDLDEAARLVADDPACLARVDQLRMYAYYLHLRLKVSEAAASKDPAAIIEAIKNETRFGARLADTNMIHFRALVGKGFVRRFRPYLAILKDVPDAQGESAKGFRGPGQPPSHAELEKLWSQWRATGP